MPNINVWIDEKDNEKLEKFMKARKIRSKVVAIQQMILDLKV